MIGYTISNIQLRKCALKYEKCETNIFFAKTPYNIYHIKQREQSRKRHKRRKQTTVSLQQSPADVGSGVGSYSCYIIVYMFLKLLVQINSLSLLSLIKRRDLFTPSLLFLVPSRNVFVMGIQFSVSPLVRWAVRRFGSEL